MQRETELPTSKNLTVLVDGDIVCWRCAASCLKQGVCVEPVEVAQIRVNELMYRIVQETEATAYKVFIGGTDNFRYKIYPEYKANRKDAAKPPWLEPCREQLLVEWQAQIVNGMETDDMLGILQSPDTVIASIDKDLFMIPGRHYNFVKQEFYNVNEVDAIRHFWFQMIMGDRTDNIPGYDGTARQTVPKFLQPQINLLMDCKDQKAMEGMVRTMYEGADMLHQFEINKKLLWILREPMDDEDYDYFGGEDYEEDDEIDLNPEDGEFGGN